MPRTLSRLALLPRGHYLPLMCVLLGAVVIAPLAVHHPALYGVMTSVLLCAGMFVVLDDRRLRRVTAVGLVVILSIRWWVFMSDEEHTALLIALHLAKACYLALLFLIVLLTVMRHPTITRNSVSGAICGYLMIAYVFGFLYGAVEFASPGSLVYHLDSRGPGGQEDAEIGGALFVYFSFVTLTTLGFGDIVPASPAARSLVVLEAVIGQIYLVAFMARIVGIMVTSRPSPSAATSHSDAA